MKLVAVMIDRWWGDDETDEREAQTLLIFQNRVIYSAFEYAYPEDLTFDRGLYSSSRLAKIILEVVGELEPGERIDIEEIKLVPKDGHGKDIIQFMNDEFNIDFEW